MDKKAGIGSFLSRGVGKFFRKPIKAPASTALVPLGPRGLATKKPGGLTTTSWRSLRTIGDGFKSSGSFNGDDWSSGFKQKFKNLSPQKRIAAGALAGGAIKGLTTPTDEGDSFTTKATKKIIGGTTGALAGASLGAMATPQNLNLVRNGFNNGLNRGKNMYDNFFKTSEYIDYLFEKVAEDVDSQQVMPLQPEFDFKKKR